MSAQPKAVRRCTWAEGHPLLTSYHDEEWGVPVHDDRMWYEKIVLDGAQAGLSWLTILKKREAYRAAFCNFDPTKVARFTERDVERLMGDPGIVRNRMKVESAIKNALDDDFEKKVDDCENCLDGRNSCSEDTVECARECTGVVAESQ